MEIHEAIEVLSEFAEHEGTELGEAWNYLLGLNQNADYISSEFSQCIEETIIKEAEAAKKNFYFEKETFTREFEVVNLVSREDSCR